MIRYILFATSIITFILGGTTLLNGTTQTQGFIGIFYLIICSFCIIFVFALDNNSIPKIEPVSQKEISKQGKLKYFNTGAARVWKRK